MAFLSTQWSSVLHAFLVLTSLVAETHGNRHKAFQSEGIEVICIPFELVLCRIGVHESGHCLGGAELLASL